MGDVPGLRSSALLPITFVFLSCSLWPALLDRAPGVSSFAGSGTTCRGWAAFPLCCPRPSLLVHRAWCSRRSLFVVLKAFRWWWWRVIGVRRSTFVCTSSVFHCAPAWLSGALLLLPCMCSLLRVSRDLALSLGSVARHSPREVSCASALARVWYCPSSAAFSVLSPAIPHTSLLILTNHPRSPPSAPP